MPDKDDFTFDDSDDLSDTDLNDVFVDGEHVNPDPEPADGARDEEKSWPDGGGGSRTRILLLLLLLVVGVGAGAYYFMDLGGTTPIVPVAPVKVVDVAPPAQPTAEQAAPPVSESVTVAVPVPLPQPLTESADLPVAGAPAPTAQEAAVAASAPPSPPPVEMAATAVVAAKPIDIAPAPTEAPAVPATVEPPAPVVSSPAKTEASLQGAAQGAYTLDAGSFLMADNRDQIVKKLRNLGYEPLVTPIKATVAMTRLSLGSFPASEVETSLAFARTIEPTAFSVPAGDGYVIYAGTFVKTQSVEVQTARFQKEGLRAKAEPVEVVKTLSRIRFGSFATREEAAEAAQKTGSAGIKSTIVKKR